MIKNWRLEYSGDGINPAAALSFGLPSSGYVFTAMPQVGTPDIEVDDQRTPRGDGSRMGQDFLGGTTIALELEVSGATASEGNELAEALRRAWRADAVRKRPGAVSVLTAESGRRAFGRPRRMAIDPTRSHVGRRTVTADFRTTDDLWYGTEQSTDTSLNPPLGGGLVAPLRAPLTTTASSSRVKTFVVGGRMPSPYAVIEIFGDITNPDIEIPGVLRQRLNLSLAADQSVVIDARPWVRTVLRNGGSVAGSLTRSSTPLSGMLIPPGEQQLILRGTSLSGNARARLRWADAFTTY